jgi:biotin-(acetyl-CoA carboxylase) ligase
MLPERERQNSSSAKAYHRGCANSPPYLAEFGWRVINGLDVTDFSDGLVVEAGSRGLLRLLACRSVRRAISPRAFSLLGPLAAACASEGVRRDTGIISWLQWPNLVTIEGRAVAKASLSHQGTGLQAVFDISVNCFATEEPAFSRGLQGTSILDALGVEIDTSLLRDKILHALDWYFAEWERGMQRKLVDRIQPTISWLGGEVEVRMLDGRLLRGVAKGLDDNGSLLLDQGVRSGKPEARTIHPVGVELVVAVK